ncbi:MAG: Zn-dependent hydrolase [Sporolactobacillus sp.]
MKSPDRKEAVQLQIQKARIGERIKQLAAFGLNAQGGVDRCFGSAHDQQARAWLSQLWQSIFQSSVRIDPVANLWIRYDTGQTLKPIVLGSHHDAVANGGKYDGAVGVLLATEVLQTLKEAKYPLRHPLMAVSFSAEEPNPYNVSTLGSRTITGILTKEDLDPVIHGATGEKITDTISRLGGDLEQLPDQILHPGAFAAFMECHIEQGRNLFDKGMSLAVVSTITGIYREKLVITGEANHAGTTLMENRHDALLAGAEISLALEEIARQLARNDVVATVGHFDVYPNSANIIPGKVELIAEIRTSDRRILQAIVEDFSEALALTEKKRAVNVSRTVILDQDAVPMHRTVQQALGQAIETMGEQSLILPSLAGHDSVHMAPITPTGMLFVPSINGKSHCPDEETELDDIVKAGNALVQAVIELDKELN